MFEEYYLKVIICIIKGTQRVERYKCSLHSALIINNSENIIIFDFEYSEILNGFTMLCAFYYYVCSLKHCNYIPVCNCLEKKLMVNHNNIVVLYLYMVLLERSICLGTLYNLCVVCFCFQTMSNQKYIFHM